MLNFDRLKFAIPLDLCSEIREELFENRIEDNLSVSKKILNDLIGVNSIELNYDDRLFIIDITGQFNAKKNNLGLINKNNINEVFEKIKKLGFVDFEIEGVIDQTKVFLCDVTQDILILDTGKLLYELKQKLQPNSSKYYVHKYNHGGITVKPVAQSRKELLNFYPKYNQLCLKKQERYREIIGHEYLEKTKNLLRVELQLKSYSLIRRYFNLEKYQEIMLKDLLMSSENPLIEKLTELGIKEVSMNGTEKIL